MQIWNLNNLVRYLMQQCVVRINDIANKNVVLRGTFNFFLKLN